MATSGPGDEPEPTQLPPPKRTLLRYVTYWIEHANALKAWVALARKRSRALDATFETIERDSQIGGVMLAGALSYRLFVFALPLAFFTVAGLGLLGSALGVDPHVVSSSIGLAGLVTKQVASTSKSGSSWWVALTSFFVLVYATRVLLRAVSIVHSLAWHRTGASVKVSPRSLGIFGAMIAGQLVLVAGIGAIGHQTVAGGVVAVAVFVFAVAGLWLVVSLNVPHAADARWVDMVPGSILYAVGSIGIVIANVLVLGNLIASKTTTYGALGTSATLLLAFFFFGRVMVGAAVLNATLYDRKSRSTSR